MATMIRRAEGTAGWEAGPEQPLRLDRHGLMDKLVLNPHLARESDEKMKEQNSIKARLLQMYDILMYEQGYEQTTVRQIADKCGIGRGHLYFYYSRKEQFPIALRANLLKKIDFIICETFPEEKGNLLLRYLATVKLVRYMFAQRRELYRAQAEYASHTEVMDGFAELQYPLLTGALSSFGLTIDQELIEESLLVATHSEYVLMKYRYGHSQEKLDHEFLFNHFCDALFFRFAFLRETVNETRARVSALFDPHAARLMERVYELDEYDFANGDETSLPA